MEIGTKNVIDYPTFEAERNFLWNRLKSHNPTFVENIFQNSIEKAFYNKIDLKILLGLGDDYRKELVLEEPSFMSDLRFSIFYETMRNVFGSEYSDVVKWISTNKIEVEVENRMGKATRNFKFGKWLSDKLANEGTRDKWNQYKVTNSRYRDESFGKLSNETIISQIIEMGKTTKKNNIIISCNPLDYFFSSEEDFCGWSSCFNWQGEYCNGNLSYMEDKMTAMIYVKGEDCDLKEYPFYKSARFWTMFLKNDKDIYDCISFGRRYGNFTDLLMIQTSNEITKAISEKQGISNKWHGKQNFDWGNTNKINEANFAGYFDYGVQRVTIHENRRGISESFNNCVPEVRLTGATCLICGNITSNDEKFCCQDCDNFVGHCEECGTLIEDNDCYHHTAEGLMCKSCFDSNYVECEVCGQNIRTEDALKSEDNGNYYCNYHYIRLHKQCSDCGRTHHIDNMRIINHKYVCGSCLVKYKPCSTCGKLEHEDNIIENDNGEPYCEDCYNKQYTSCACCFKEIKKVDGIKVENHEFLCHDCTACQKCNQYIKKEDVIQHGDYSLCQKCSQSVSEIPNTMLRN